MGAIAKIFGAQTSRAQTSGTANPAQWFLDWATGGKAASSGVKVTEASALRYSPFWAAVRIISGTLAALPFLVYRRIPGGGKERVTDHPAYRLLHNRPNDHMDAMTFIESRQAHALTYGNGYAEIQRDGAGRPVKLWPLLPNRTTRKIDKQGVPYYEVKSPTGGTVQLPDYNVLHIMGLGFDSYRGYNVVSQQREAIGYGVAVKEYGARFFSGDGSPSGVLEHPQNLSKEAAERLKESWAKGHAGLSRSHRLQVLEEGMKWTKTGVEPGKAQALEVQKYTVDDCARIFNIPPHKLASMERATFSNIEEQNIDFVTSTMFYWFRKWEAECNYKLFMPGERDQLFCEILIDGLLRGDIESRYTAYNIGRNAGFLSVDDIREKENMNPLPAGRGDIYLEPLNMKQAGTADPSPAEPDAPSDSDDALRQMMRDMIEDVFRRVITKRRKAGHRVDILPWAVKILTDPTKAYAATVNTTESRANQALNQALGEYVSPDRILEPLHAGAFADRVVNLIGENHVQEN